MNQLNLSFLVIIYLSLPHEINNLFYSFQQHPIALYVCSSNSFINWNLLSNILVLLSQQVVNNKSLDFEY